METPVKRTEEVEVKTLSVVAHVRYWCDATVNGLKGVDDDEAADPGIPCRVGDSWCPVIDVDTGQITNWTKGTTATVHYKVCDAGVYELLDPKGNRIATLDGYVPSMMSPDGNGYGDYIKMTIDADGFIEGWEFDAGQIIDEE